jgi:hypothetical protein
MLLRVLLAFLAGATLGTALDQIHVHSGLTYYTSPVALGAAAWVPLVFGPAAVLLALVPPRLTRLLLPPVAAELRPTREVVIDFLLFVAAYFTTGLLAAVDGEALTRPRLTLVVLLAVWLARIGSAARRAPSPAREAVVGAALCGVTAVLGPLVEHLITLGGGFGYRRPELIVYWLPPLYLFAGLLGRSIGRAWFGGR